MLFETRRYEEMEPISIAAGWGRPFLDSTRCGTWVKSRLSVPYVGSCLTTLLQPLVGALSKPLDYFGGLRQTPEGAFALTSKQASSGQNHGILLHGEIARKLNSFAWDSILEESNER